MNELKKISFNVAQKVNSKTTNIPHAILNNKKKQSNVNNTSKNSLQKQGLKNGIKSVISLRPL